MKYMYIGHNDCVPRVEAWVESENIIKGATMYSRPGESFGLRGSQLIFSYFSSRAEHVYISPNNQVSSNSGMPSLPEGDKASADSGGWQQNNL